MIYQENVRRMLIHILIGISNHLVNKNTVKDLKFTI